MKSSNVNKNRKIKLSVLSLYHTTTDYLNLIIMLSSHNNNMRLQLKLYIVGRKSENCRIY